MSRCTGHCCRFVDLPVPVEAIVEAEILEGGDVLVTHGSQPGRSFRVSGTDAAILVDALTPVHVVRALEDGGASPTFTHLCRHWTGRDCAIYATRPELCRSYPNGRACTYRGCTREDPPVEPLEPLGKAEVDP